MLLVLAVLALYFGMTGQYHCLLPSRLSKLHCAINTHTGSAHFTRGMNTETIAALDKAAPGEEDAYLLSKLLESDDNIAVMTSAEVLKKRGPKGQEYLMKVYSKAKDANDAARAALIKEYGGLPQ